MLGSVEVINPVTFIPLPFKTIDDSSRECPSLKTIKSLYRPRKIQILKTDQINSLTGGLN